MQPLFLEVSTLDSAAVELFGMSHELLMENAARSLAELIRARFRAGSVVRIVSGPGNNGADGIALARMLWGDYRVRLWLPLGCASDLAKLQLRRAQALGIEGVEKLGQGDVLVDALFGSGLSRDLGLDSLEVIREMNEARGYKIACDIPSGIDSKGNPRPIAFKADLTCAMGAIREALLSDSTKEFVGELVVGNLGISQRLYEQNQPPSAYLLGREDVRLPWRVREDSHKGSYGHLAVVAGEREGAAVLAALAGLHFGAGLVSLVGEVKNPPYELMQGVSVPKGASALACGMGLGERECPKEAWELPSVLDADILGREEILSLLEKNPSLVLTPHPKEFANLLGVLGIAQVSALEVQKDRMGWARIFGERYPRAVLLLKGANPVILQGERLYINPLGGAMLAKGGSGDVLSGIIASLLAQGRSPLESAIEGSLAHTLAASRVEKANYALTPLDLVQALGKLSLGTL